MTTRFRSRGMWSAGAGATVVAVGASIAFLAVVIAAAAPEHLKTAPQPQISIRWTPDSSGSSRVAVEVDGLTAAALEKLRRSNWSLPQWHRLFSVYAQQGDANATPNVPPMLGTYRILSGVLRFEPQFPLQSGVTYRAILWPHRLPDENGLGGDSIT